MVNVISPATLEAGSTFEAKVDGKTFTVTVPDGGIGEGDDFEVPYPHDVEEAVHVATAAIAVPVPVVVDGDGDDSEEGLVVKNTNANTNTNEAIAFEVPTGTWRKELCSCCDACCCPFWMGCCCFPILMGQGTSIVIEYRV